MIDRADPTASTLALLLLRAMKSFDDGKLVQLLSDDDWIVRRAAALELHARPAAANLQAISVLAASHRHEVRQACAHALSQLGTPDHEHCIGIEKILVPMLSDHYWEVRSEVARALGWLCVRDYRLQPEGLTAILRLEHDPRPEVRVALASSLLSIKESASQLVLVRLSKDPSPDVRREAQDSLCRSDEVAAH